jgi:hypothetical protein
VQTPVFAPVQETVQWQASRYWPVPSGVAGGAWSRSGRFWKHLRTTNPIETTFATVRHRTVRSKGCLSNRTAIAMVFKLAQAAEKSWRRLDGHSQLPKLISP